jgi:hypothetical protein
MSFLTHTCTIQRHSGAVNALNELAASGFATHLTDVACRFKDNDVREPSSQTAAVLASTYVLYLPAGTDVTEADRISTVTTPDGIVAGPFTIERVLTRRDGSGRGRHMTLGLERVEVN